MNRRHFLMGTAGALGAAQFKSHLLGSPNDTVRVACVGVRGQGNSHLKEYGKMKNVEIAAICDIDETVLNQRLGDVEVASGRRPTGYWDIRKLLEDKSIDVISIATPNHSHTLQTIWSLQAGKHVYCEKPCSHDVFESRQIVAASEKYGKIVQHGTNSRSGVAIREAMEKMNEGLIGDVYHARGLCYKWRDTIGRAAVEPIPAGVHYDQWLGPAPKHEFTKKTQSIAPRKRGVSATFSTGQKVISALSGTTSTGRIWARTRNQDRRARKVGTTGPTSLTPFAPTIQPSATHPSRKGPSPPH